MFLCVLFVGMEYQNLLRQEGLKYGWGFLLIKRQEFYRFIESLIKKFGKVRVLDVGCWKCLMYTHLRERYGDAVVYVGIDVVDNQDRVRDAEFYLMNGESLLFPPESFHAVIYIESLEHIIDYVKALREAYRVLKREGGVFIQTTMPNTDNAWKDETHYHVLHPITLKRLLVHIGFKDVGYAMNGTFAVWGYK